MFAELSREESSSKITGWDDPNSSMGEENLSTMMIGTNMALINPTPPVQSKAVAKATSPRKLKLSMLDVNYLHGTTKYNLVVSPQKQSTIADGGNVVAGKSKSGKQKRKKSAKRQKPSKKKVQEDLELKYETSRKMLIKTFSHCCHTLGLPENVVISTSIAERLNRVPDTKQKESWFMDTMSCRGPDINSAITRSFVSSLHGNWLGGNGVTKNLSSGYEFLRVLDFVDCNCGAAGATAVAQYLNTRNGKALRKLSFFRSSVTVTGAQALSNSLRFGYNKTLQELHINCDLTIGDEGAIALCRGIGTNSTLRVFSFICCGCGEKGAEGIANVIAYANSSISALSFRGNTIGPKGLEAIALAIKKNKALTYLNLANIGVGPLHTEAIRKFAESLLVCKTLSSVDFNYNSFGDPGAHAFLNALETTKDGSNSSHIKQLAITNQISADLFDRLYRTTRGSKKGKKSKKKGGSAGVEILPDLHYALEWMGRLKKLEAEKEAEDKKGDKSRGNKGSDKKR